MELSSYCDNVATELINWKARVHDVVRKLDRAPTGDKSSVLSEVNDLHMIIEELDDRISRLSSTCSVSWEPERTGFAERFGHLQKTWQGVWEHVSPAEIGG